MSDDKWKEEAEQIIILIEHQPLRQRALDVVKQSLEQAYLKGANNRMWLEEQANEKRNNNE